MKKYLIIAFFLFTAIGTYAQTATFVIDPSIKTEVEKKIEFIPEYNVEDYLIYKNPPSWDYYEDDTFLFSINENIGENLFFQSYYGWSNDTLKIEGLYGFSHAAGFSIHIIDGEAQLYHLVESESESEYYYASTESGSLLSRLEVPCTEAHIILSEIPDPLSKDTVYGYVDFKSANYYYGVLDDETEEEIMPRKKERYDMRIYFMSNFLDLKSRRNQED